MKKAAYLCLKEAIVLSFIGFNQAACSKIGDIKMQENDNAIATSSSASGHDNRSTEPDVDKLARDLYAVELARDDIDRNKISLIELLAKNRNRYDRKAITIQDIKLYQHNSLLDENSNHALFCDVVDDIGRKQNGDIAQCGDQESIEVLNLIYNMGVDINKVKEACSCYRYSRGEDCFVCFGNTALMECIANGNDGTYPRVATLLLTTYQASPFVKDHKDDKNALHLLLLKDHLEQQIILEAVLNHSAADQFINAQTGYGDTALHIACARRDGAKIKMLLMKGADKNISNSDGQRPKDMLYMDETGRLKFLWKYLNWENGFCGSNGLGDFTLQDSNALSGGIATIDMGVFNSDPDILERYFEGSN